MKTILVTIALILTSATPACATATHPRHCKTLSVVKTEQPVGTRYQDGTSETVTILKIVTRERCRGKIITHTEYRYE